jgi:hypothetical protein
MPLAASLALALVLPPADAAPPESPLSECEIGEHDETTTLLMCRNWMASAAHMAADPGVWEAMVSAHLAGVALASGASLADEHIPRTIAGRAFLTAALVLGEPDTPILRGTVAWPAQPGPSLDLFSCIYPVRDPFGAPRCDVALETLVARGIPAGLPAVQPDVPRIAGRQVPVGEGCQAQSEVYAGMINCMAQGGGSLQWVQLDQPATPQDLAALREGALRELQAMRPGTWTTEQVACRLEGAAGTCWRFSQEGEPPQRRSLVAYAEFRGIPLVAKCLYKGEPGALLAPCTEILEF